MGRMGGFDGGAFTMGISAATLFGSTTSAAAAVKIPAASAAAAPAEGGWKAVSADKAKGVTDKVEISALGKALKGVAGDVFAALGTKARGMLEGLVKSNQMTTDEVSLGLRALATNGLYQRFSKERPQDADDADLAEQGKVLSAAAQRRETRVSAAQDKMIALIAPSRDGGPQDPAADAARTEQVDALKAEIDDAQKEEWESVGGDPSKKMGALFGARLKRDEEAFKRADFGDTADGYLALDDKKGQDALKRFTDLGFKPELFKNGLNKFVANVDIPEVGKGTYTESAEYEPAAPDPEPEAAVITDATLMLDEAAKAASKESASKGMAGMGKVTKDARDALDDGYLKLSANGKAADFGKGDETIINTVFSGLDRRSLFAVASNGGGLFSDTEQKAALSLMNKQQDEAAKRADPTGNDASARLKAGIAFLDGVSAEEKASANWSVQRAASQLAYENAVRAENKPSLVADSQSPVVRMIKEAMAAKKDQSFEDMAGKGFVKDLAAMPLFRQGVPSVKGYLTIPVDVRV